MRHLNNGTDHRHSKSCCDQSSPARRTMSPVSQSNIYPQNMINSSPPGQNGRHLGRWNFKCIFFHKKARILIKISLKFVPNGVIDNNQALV